MSIKIHCCICDSVCGVREPITFKLMKGATVEIVATCRKCNQPPQPSPDCDIFDLLKEFGMQ